MISKKQRAQLRAVILDMDGVLVDSEPCHMQAFKIFLNEYGIAAEPQFLQDMIGISIEDNIKQVVEQFPVFIGQDWLKLRDQRNRIYMGLISKEALSPVQGITALIDYCLNCGLKIALATSSSREQMQAIIKSLQRNPDFELQLENIFDSIVCGDDVMLKKPAADIYLQSLKNLDCKPEEAIAVEDSVAGIQSANAARIFSVALKNPYADFETFTAYKLAIDTPYDLIEMLLEGE